MDRICVFCGASRGSRPAYAEVAARLGRVLAERGTGLVTGGGSVGLMGVVADAALAAGGEVIGVIPEALADLELAHPGLDLRIVPSMHERKTLMHDLARGFVTLPGGLGSLEEALETLTWLQLGFHEKPLGFVNVEGFYDPLLAMLDRATEHGFVAPENRAMILVDPTPEGLLDRFASWTPPARRKWLDRAEL